jgi:hypothetical protein
MLKAFVTGTFPSWLKAATRSRGAPRAHFISAKFKVWPYLTGFLAFRYLVSQGLKKNDIFVDYGCGRLRLGKHAMKYLATGCYWGMDLNESRWQKSFASPSLIAQKRPNLRVISPDSIEEVSAQKPTLLCSLKVMTHVHPSDLEEFLSNIIKIVRPHGKAIIKSKWSDDRTLFIPRSERWAHSILTVKKVVESNGARLTVVRQERKLLGQEVAKSGILRIDFEGAR